MSVDYLDIVIIGAGLSGIGGACHIAREMPGKSYIILESRGAMGGTWDLFRYPGIRSDSDMHTLGYNFKPWQHRKAIADGPSILSYINDTAREYAVDQHIRYHQRVIRISWCGDSALWTLTISDKNNQLSEITCRFIYSCTGYYRYDKGYTPKFFGADDFAGQIIHPQHWPEDLDYRDKKVVVIGSGATAVTLVPAMAKTASHVTMLQRSPTYVISRPDEDKIAQTLSQYLPAKLAYLIIRWKNVSQQALLFQMSRRWPRAVKRMLLKWAQTELGNNFDVNTHFNPTYKPWDQRLCLVPNGDLFSALREGTASVVTDHIKSFTKHGIALRSGQELQADIIVSATGLELLALGGMEIEVDGHRINLSDRVGYRGMMLTDIPNLIIATGYTNASWTLKCDLTSEYMCRMLQHMDRHNLDYCVSRKTNDDMQLVDFIDLRSGYIDRAIKDFPKQGSQSPFKLYQNYLLDILSLRFGSLKDRALEYGKASSN